MPAESAPQSPHGEGWVWGVLGAVLALPIVGQWNASVALTQLLLVLPLGLVVVGYAGWCLVTKRRLRWLVAPPLVYLALRLSGQLTFGLPAYARWDAEALMADLERQRAELGAYPTEHQPASITGCSYDSEPASYRIDCQGVLFTRCRYESASSAWTCHD